MHRRNCTFTNTTYYYTINICVNITAFYLNARKFTLLVAVQELLFQ